MNAFKRYGLAIGVVLAGLVGSANAELRLPKVFSDHMVLQRDLATPVWGWADPGEAVTVTFAGQSLAATADKTGRWQVRLAPLKAECKSQELTVAGKTTNTVVRDILVGDVWLCSGQSNMEFGLGNADNAQDVIPAATNAMIRLLSVKSPQAGQAVDDVPAPWVLCDKQSVGAFSAVGYFFGRKIQKETGIPIGLINNAWGGTAIELWMPSDAPAAFPELAKISQEFDQKQDMFRHQLAKVIDPVGQWVEKARQAQAKGESIPFPPTMPTHPAIGSLSGIYNGRVTPLIPFGIKGALWYQGEANGSDDDIYAVKTRALVSSWRKAWNQGDFPFYFVQLANFKDTDTIPAGGSGWAKVRMAQFKSLEIPHTGMALAIDIGDAKDIHPKNKEDVGDRLAFWALKYDYGQKGLICSGPLYKGMAIEGSKIRVSFDYAATGLMVGEKTGHGPATESQNGVLKRFAVSGASNAWFWADAVIDGSTVLVSSTNVPAPVAVRYAFSMNPEGCNLYNKEGLPASPFRTDTW
ncbi:MAG: sialate O-acetylesterase [bacterium]